MYTMTFGSLKFTSFDGDPLVSQTVWEQIERSGVQGVLWADAGQSPPPFAIQTWTDWPSWALAHDFARLLQEATSLAPQQLTLAGYTYPTYFKLVQVSQPRVRAIQWGRGGLCENLAGGPYTAKALVMAQLVLREVPAADLPETP
jgi:hypothetical protein